jgi:hypothetical protein
MQFRQERNHRLADGSYERRPSLLPNTSRDASKIRPWRTSIRVEVFDTSPCLPRFRPDGLRRTAFSDGSYGSVGDRGI